MTVTQSEKGIVTRTRRKESIVRSMAHTPGPSGSAGKLRMKKILTTVLGE